MKLPDGEGKAELVRTCSGCHGLETAIDATRTESGWRRIVDSMAGRGAEGTDEEFTKIVKYLTKNFGVPIRLPPKRRRALLRKRTAASRH